MLMIYVFQDVQNNQKFVGSQPQTVMAVYVQEVVMVGNLCVQQDHHYFVVLEHKVSVTQNATTTTAE
jgi:hypothetical protein